MSRTGCIAFLLALVCLCLVGAVSGMSYMLLHGRLRVYLRPRACVDRCTDRQTFIYTYVHIYLRIIGEESSTFEGISNLENLKSRFDAAGVSYSDTLTYRPDVDAASYPLEVHGTAFRGEIEKTLSGAGIVEVYYGSGVKSFTASLKMNGVTVDETNELWRLRFVSFTDGDTLSLTSTGVVNLYHINVGAPIATNTDPVPPQFPSYPAPAFLSLDFSGLSSLDACTQYLDTKGVAHNFDRFRFNGFPAEADGASMYSAGDDGFVAITFTGEGNFALTYGSWAPSWTVEVLLDNSVIASTTERKEVVSGSFTNGQVLKIREENAVMVLYSLSTTGSEGRSISA